MGKKNNILEGNIDIPFQSSMSTNRNLEIP